MEMKDFALFVRDGIVTIEHYKGDAKHLVVPAMFYDYPVKAIELWAFSSDNCPELENVVIEEGICTIHTKAFECCKSLKSVTIPNSVEAIGDCVFTDCPALESVMLPARFKACWNQLFYGCPNLKEIIYTDRLKGERICLGAKGAEMCSSIRIC